MKNDHAIARHELAHDSFADGGDDARGFMAVDAGRRQKIVFDLLQIGVADATALDANQDLARADDGSFNGLDRDPALAPIDSGLHRVRGAALRAETELLGC